ncbi:MAG: hypothetical protein M3Z92_01615 [Bacteroidota bacterium]|nr:hypothetical protein [Bacteroidota bacterium]
MDFTRHFFRLYFSFYSASFVYCQHQEAANKRFATTQYKLTVSVNEAIAAHRCDPVIVLYKDYYFLFATIEFSSVGSGLLASDKEFSGLK